MTKKSLAHPAQPASAKEREEAEERFGGASRAHYLLTETGCSEERLERAGRAMDRWAKKLRVP